MNKFLSMVSLCSSLALIPAVATAGKPAVQLIGADELKFEAVPKAPPEVKMAMGFGTPKRGLHGAFHKFAAGFAAPLHWHSSPTHGVIVAGSMTITPEGGVGKELGVGSFFSIPRKKKHTTTCKAGADCIMFVVAPGKFDVKMPKAKKKNEEAAKAAPAAEEKKE